MKISFKDDNLKLAMEAAEKCLADATNRNAAANANVAYAQAINAAYVAYVTNGDAAAYARAVRAANIAYTDTQKTIQCWHVD